MTRKFYLPMCEISGYICNTAVYDGVRIYLTPKEQEEILSEYYHQTVVVEESRDKIAIKESPSDGHIAFEEWGDDNGVVWRNLRCPNVGRYLRDIQVRRSKAEKVPNLDILAKANMLRNGKSFMVVQMPDWNGGHFFRIREYDYECRDFEYVAWLGTPLVFATEQPLFVGHVEPFHDEPYDYEVTALELISAAVKRWN